MSHRHTQLVGAIIQLTIFFITITYKTKANNPDRTNESETELMFFFMIASTHSAQWKDGSANRLGTHTSKP